MANEAISTATKTQIRYPNRYNVIILNDDTTSMDFVVSLLVELFNKDIATAQDIMLEVHHNGQAVAGTYSAEIATQKKQEAEHVAQHNGYSLKLKVEKV